MGRTHEGPSDDAGGRVRRDVTSVEVVLLAGALTIAAGSAEPFTAGPRDLIAFLGALAMGMQNSAARGTRRP